MRLKIIKWKKPKGSYIVASEQKTLYSSSINAAANNQWEGKSGTLSIQQSCYNDAEYDVLTFEKRKCLCRWTEKGTFSSPGQKAPLCRVADSRGQEWVNEIEDPTQWPLLSFVLILFCAINLPMVKSPPPLGRSAYPRETGTETTCFVNRTNTLRRQCRSEEVETPDQAHLHICKVSFCSTCVKFGTHFPPFIALNSKQNVKKKKQVSHSKVKLYSFFSLFFVDILQQQKYHFILLAKTTTN